MVADLRRIVWSASPDERRRWLSEGQMEERVATLLAREAEVFDEPACERRQALSRLRDLAMDLVKAREFRLQERIWRRTLAMGIIPANAWQRIFLAQVGDERLAEAIDTARTLLDLGDVRARTRRHIRNAVARFVSEAADPGAAASFVRERLGFRFAAAVMDSVPEPRSEAAAFVAEATRRAVSDDALLPLAAVLARYSPSEARRLLASAPASAGSPLLAELARAILAESEDDHVSVAGALDRLAALVTTAGAPSMSALVLQGAIAGRAQHPSLGPIATSIASGAAAIPFLWEMFFDHGVEGRTALPFLAALAAAGADPLELLDLTFAAGAEFDEASALAAERLIEADESPSRNERTVGLLLAMQDAPLVRDVIVASFARRHTKRLCSGATGAAAYGRALAAIKDWEGALSGWDCYLAAVPGAPWILGQAAHAAVQLGQPPRASAYLSQVDLDDARAAPAFLTLAHAAFLSGEDALGMELLEKLPPETDAADTYNMAGRLRALMSGNAARLARGTPIEQPTAPSPPPAVLVVDPGFAQNSGHHFPYNKFSVEFFSAELDTDPAAVWICTRREIEGAPFDPIEDPEVAASMHRLFDYNPYFFDEFPKTRANLANLSRAWESDLARGMTGIDLTSVRVIFFHSMKANLVLGLARWISATFAGRSVRVVIGVIEVDYLSEGAEVRHAVEDLYGEAFRVLSATPAISLVVYAETASGCASLARTAQGLPIHHIPYLAAALAGPAEAAALAFGGETVTVGLLGGSRAERGLDLFPEAIRALSGRRELRWIVQLDRTAAELMDEAYPEHLEQAVADGILEWFSDRLTSEDYYDALRRLDVVLMPYRDRYAVSGSGVFFEAMQLERYVVVPEATTMGEIVREFGYPATILPDATIEAVIPAIEAILARKAELADQMRALRASPAPTTPLERFRTLVREAAGADPAIVPGYAS